MKLFNLIILTAFAAAALSACGNGSHVGPSKSNQLGGISVGNPTGSMSWSGSSVSLQYDKSLSVESTSDRSVVISNQKLLKGKGQKSTFKLDVVTAPGEAGPRNKKELRKFVSSREKTDSLKEIKRGSGIGYAVSSPSDDNTKKERAYLIASNGTVVMLESAITMSAIGANLVDAIPDTIDFDDKAPVVKAIRFSSNKIVAGQEVQVEFDIDEESPGLEDESVEISFANKDGSQGFFRDLEFKSRKGNTYYSHFRTNELLPTGSYELANLHITDIWLNARFIARDPKTGILQETPDGTVEKNANEIIVSSKVSFDTMIKSSLQSPTLEVTNSEIADLEFPKIKSVRLLTPEVEAGSNLAIEVVVSDDVAKIQSNKIEVNFYNQYEDGATQSLAHLELSNYTEISEKEHEPGVFLIKISIPAFAAPRTLSIASISVGDESGKASSWISDISKNGDTGYETHWFYDERYGSLDLPFETMTIESTQRIERPGLPKLSIINKGIIDENPPRWVDSKIEKNSSEDIWKWDWTIEVKDEGSGLWPEMDITWARIPENNVQVQSWDDARSTSLMLTPLGNDKYKVETDSLRDDLTAVKSDGQIEQRASRPGQYIISSIKFRDKAMSAIYFNAFRKNEVEIGYSVLDTQSEPVPDEEMGDVRKKAESFKTHRKIHKETSKTYEVSTTQSLFKNMNFGPAEAIIEENGKFPVIEFPVK